MNLQQLSKNVELEKILFNKLPEHLRSGFQKKFAKNNSSYWQIISEARAVIVFDDLGIPVKEIDFTTVKNKDVDFLAVFESERIYTEVKGFMLKIFNLAKRGEWLGTDEEKIDRALRRAQPKFPDSSCNILVISDENVFKSPLYDNPRVDSENIPGMYMNHTEYIKTSAIMILGGLYKDQLFEFMIWYNTNPQKSLPQNAVNIFDQKKTNKY